MTMNRPGDAAERRRRCRVRVVGAQRLTSQGSAAGRQRLDLFVVERGGKLVPTLETLRHLSVHDAYESDGRLHFQRPRQLGESGNKGFACIQGQRLEPFVVVEPEL